MKGKKGDCPTRKGNYGKNVKRMTEYHSECKRCLAKEEFMRHGAINPVVKPRSGEIRKEIIERRAGNRKVLVGRKKLVRRKGVIDPKLTKNVPPSLKKLNDYETY